MFKITNVRLPAFVSARPAQVLVMDADDSSNESHIEQQTRDQERTIFAGLNHGRQFGERVRGPSHCDEDHSTIREGHIEGCFESKFTRGSSWSTKPGSHNGDLWVETFLLIAEDLVAQTFRVWQLQERVDKFVQGHWVPLLETSLELCKEQQ